MNPNDPRRLRRLPLTSAIVASLLISGAALAQDAAAGDGKQPPAAQSAQQDDNQQTIDKIEVVGSRIKRAEVEGPSPVTVISAAQIEKEGFNTVFDALETLSQNTGFGQNDFNAAGGFTPNASVINLRGLGPGRTLLLINGRRVNDYPFPYNGRSNFQNFNSIPAAAVDRIEVLAGGASAIYGSDAVAGVINVVLKTNYEGNILKLKGQTSTRGGRDIGDLQWVGGKTGDNWSVVYALESYNAEPLWGYQRDFMDSAADNPAPPGVNGSPGFGGYQPPIGIQIRRLNSAGSTLGYVLPAGRNCSGSSRYRPHTYVSTTTGATLGPGCGYDRSPAEQTVLNGNNDQSGYVYGNYQFNDNLEAWATAMVFHSRSRLSGGVEQWFGGPQPNASFYDPNLGIRILPIRTLTPESYGGSEGTMQKFEENSYDLAFGLRGSIANRFDWEWTIGGAKYDAKRERPRLTVDGATNYFLGTRLGTTSGIPGVPNGLPIYRLNLDRFYGPISAADYASMSTMVKYHGTSDNASTSFVLSGDLFELPAGAVSFAGVLEATRQSYDLKSDARIAPNVRAIYNLTGTGGGGKRSKYAIGTEFRVPVTSMLELSLAGRYDKYDDITNVDDAKTWAAGLEFRPFKNLLIRGNYSTSFKAPDMHYIFSDLSGSFGTVTDYYRCFADGVSTDPQLCAGAGARYRYSAFTTSEGSKELKEETGKSWTAGFVWDITDAFSVSADYYNIRLENTVTVQSGDDLLRAELGCRTGRLPTGEPYPETAGSPFCNLATSRVIRDPNTLAILELQSRPVNVALLGTKGIDATAQYRFSTERFGDYRTSLSWSHVLEQTQRLAIGSPLQSYRDFNSNSDYRSRIRWTTNWNKGDWDATVFMNRTGSFPIWNPNNTRFTTGRIGSRTGPNITWNMTVGKKITDKLYVRGNINNIFDHISPQDGTFNSYPYFWQGYSPVGREIGLELSYKIN